MAKDQRFAALLFVQECGANLDGTFDRLEASLHDLLALEVLQHLEGRKVEVVGA